jgi:hypothetical protein
MDQVASDAQQLTQECSNNATTIEYCEDCEEDMNTCHCYAPVRPLYKSGISVIPPYTHYWCLNCNVVGACLCEHRDRTKLVPLLPVSYPFRMPLLPINDKYPFPRPHPGYRYVNDCRLASLLEGFYAPLLC